MRRCWMAQTQCPSLYQVHTAILKTIRFQRRLQSWKPASSSPRISNSASITFSSSSSKVGSGHSSASCGRPSSAASGFGTDAPSEALLFLRTGEGLLRSITPVPGRRDWKTARSRFTSTRSFLSLSTSQLVHPKLARSVSTSMGSRRVSRANNAFPSVYLSRPCEAEGLQ